MVDFLILDRATLRRVEYAGLMGGEASPIGLLPALFIAPSKLLRRVLLMLSLQTKVTDY